MIKRSNIWAFIFIFGSYSLFSPHRGFSQSSLSLPTPGTRIAPSAPFAPVLLKGIKFDPDNPLRFDFLIDHGHLRRSQDFLAGETQKLVKYFLAALTTPQQDLWVNLSPHEPDRIIPEELGQTEMGGILLAQDYLLKQLTASLLYPEEDLGHKFWNRVYEKAYELYGTTDIPTETFHKVWIVPDKAVIYENEGTAFVVESRLKVLMEEDYWAMQEAPRRPGTQKPRQSDQPGGPGAGKLGNQMNDISSEALYDLILPEIEREVNEGKHFAQLRQIYNALILAVWFKQVLKESLLGHAYVDQSKIAGIELPEKGMKQRIYHQYLEAYKKGVYNYIREEQEYSSAQRIVPRKYFSGGAALSDTPHILERVGLHTLPALGPASRVSLWLSQIVQTMPSRNVRPQSKGFRSEYQPQPSGDTAMLTPRDAESSTHFLLHKPVKKAEGLADQCPGCLWQAGNGSLVVDKTRLFFQERIHPQEERASDRNQLLNLAAEMGFLPGLISLPEGEEAMNHVAIGNRLAQALREEAQTEEEQALRRWLNRVAQYIEELGQREQTAWASFFSDMPLEQRVFLRAEQFVKDLLVRRQEFLRDLREQYLSLSKESIQEADRWLVNRLRDFRLDLAKDQLFLSAVQPGVTIIETLYYFAGPRGDDVRSYPDHREVRYVEILSLLRQLEREAQQASERSHRVDIERMEQRVRLIIDSYLKAYILPLLSLRALANPDRDFPKLQELSAEVSDPQQGGSGFVLTHNRFPLINEELSRKIYHLPPHHRLPILVASIQDGISDLAFQRHTLDKVPEKADGMMNQSLKRILRELHLVLDDFHQGISRKAGVSRATLAEVVLAARLITHGLERESEGLSVWNRLGVLSIDLEHLEFLDTWQIPISAHETLWAMLQLAFQYPEFADQPPDIRGVEVSERLKTFTLEEAFSLRATAEPELKRWWLTQLRGRNPRNLVRLVSGSNTQPKSLLISTILDLQRSSAMSTVLKIENVVELAYPVNAGTVYGVKAVVRHDPDRPEQSWVRFYRWDRYRHREVVAMMLGEHLDAVAQQPELLRQLLGYELQFSPYGELLSIWVRSEINMKLRENGEPAPLSVSQVASANEVLLAAMDLPSVPVIKVPAELVGDPSTQPRNQMQFVKTRIHSRYFSEPINRKFFRKIVAEEFGDYDFSQHRQEAAVVDTSSFRERSLRVVRRFWEHVAEYFFRAGLFPELQSHPGPFRRFVDFSGRLDRKGLLGWAMGEDNALQLSEQARAAIGAELKLISREISLVLADRFVNQSRILHDFNNFFTLPLGTLDLFSVVKEDIVLPDLTELKDNRILNFIFDTPQAAAALREKVVQLLTFLESEHELAVEILGEINGLSPQEIWDQAHAILEEIFEQKRRSEWAEYANLYRDRPISLRQLLLHPTAGEMDFPQIFASMLNSFSEELIGTMINYGRRDIAKILIRQGILLISALGILDQQLEMGLVLIHPQDVFRAGEFIQYIRLIQAKIMAGEIGDDLKEKAFARLAENVLRQGDLLTDSSQPLSEQRGEALSNLLVGIERLQKDDGSLGRQGLVAAFQTEENRRRIRELEEVLDSAMLVKSIPKSFPHGGIGFDTTLDLERAGGGYKDFSMRDYDIEKIKQELAGLKISRLDISDFSAEDLPQFLGLPKDFVKVSSPPLVSGK